MILDKKQIRAILWFKFKMGCKAAETICNINNPFGPRTTKNVQCSGGSRFANGGEAARGSRGSPPPLPLEAAGGEDIFRKKKLKK